MSDPINRLENFNREGLPVTPIAPSEVRRLGNRMRRRRNAAAVVGAVAAVAVIATPIALFAGSGSGGSGPGPSEPSTITDTPTTTTPTATPGPSGWVTRIPDDFPLADGWPDPSLSEYDEALKGPGRELRAFAFEACGNRVPDPGSSDRLNASWTNAEDFRGRELRTFRTDQEAVTYLAHLRVLWQECAQETGSDGYTRLRSVRPTEAGDESFALVTHLEFQGAPGIGLSIAQVVRIGNAVHVDETSTEGTANDTARQLAAMADESAGVVDAMCVFAEGGCGDPRPTRAQAIPDDFPLDIGMAEGDIEMVRTDPAPDAAGIGTMTPCGVQVWPLRIEERLAANVHGPEYVDDRELVTFSGVDQAIDAVEDFRAAARACPTEDGWGWHLLDEDTGYDSATVGYTRTDGTLGSSVYQMTRVGRAVLFVETYGEGNVDTLPAQADILTRITQDVGPEMCRFTADGC